MGRSWTRSSRARSIPAASRRQPGGYLGDLLEVNAVRVERDLAERVADMRAAFERSIRRALDAVVGGARPAEVEAGRMMAEGQAAVVARQRSLNDALAVLDRISAT